MYIYICLISLASFHIILLRSTDISFISAPIYAVIFHPRWQHKIIGKLCIYRHVCQRKPACLLLWWFFPHLLCNQLPWHASLGYFVGPFWGYCNFLSTCHCMINVSKMHGVSTLRPKQNGCHFADGFSNAFSWNQRVLIPMDFIRVFNYVYTNTSSYNVLTRNKQQAIHNLFSSGDLLWWRIYAGLCLIVLQHRCCNTMRQSPAYMRQQSKSPLANRLWLVNRN